jgi:hypothetical protein
MLSPDPLSSLFDGWMTMLDPDVDFVWTERSHILSWEEDEDEILGPYESPTPIPVLSEWPGGEWNTPDGKSVMPFHYEQMAWAGFNLALQTLSKIVGGKPEAYQHVSYGPDGKGPMDRPTYSFRFVAGETGWQCSEGARL